MRNRLYFYGLILLFSWIYIATFIFANKYINRAEERAQIESSKYSDLVNRVITIRGPQEYNIRSIIKTHMLAKGLDLKYAWDIRAIGIRESWDTQFVADGSVFTELRANGKYMVVGWGNHYVKRGHNQWIKNGYDLRTLEGNVGATVDELIWRYKASGSWDIALNGYNGVAKKSWGYAAGIHKTAQKWANEKL